MKIEIGGIETEYIRKNVKRLRIRITSFGEVVLTVPQYMSFSEAESFFLSKKDWIIKHKKAINDETRQAEKKLSDGAVIFLFGEKITLRAVYGDRNTAKLYDDELFVTLKSLDELNKTIEKFLADELKKVLDVTFARWTEITGLHPSGISIRKTSSRWGSCTPATRKIRMSLYLANMPEECSEYVTLHELLHIKYPNHGAGFHAALDRYMPEWKKISKFMNAFGGKYRIYL